jgi:transcriptional antiterminator NusG
MTPNSAPNWYAISTRARHEKIVQQQLVSKQIEVFLPTVARWSRWKDRRKKIDWPLFAGYCFARFAMTDTLPILRCAGVLRIVSFGGAPAPIAPHEIHSLQVVLSKEMAGDPCPFIREGMMVEVTDGPLRGVVGRLLRKDAHRAIVVLSVDLIGQALRVEVAAGDIATCHLPS